MPAKPIRAPRPGHPTGRRPIAGPLAAVALALLPGLAAAQDSNGLAGHDSRQPIEITSDTLTVEQPKQIATFAGNVDAIQGDMKLRADRLVVHYARREGAAASSGTDPTSNSIQKIEAFGRVFITSPTETAQGDHGTYDVVGRTIQLIDDVVLTRGGNVIRGTRLDMDLNSGVSKVSGGTANQRVRALFTPQQGNGGQGSGGQGAPAGNGGQAPSAGGAKGSAGTSGQGNP